jgi:lipopolysaccharide/colanic/teichoic acid biosynthesis glycosyltransferase
MDMGVRTKELFVEDRRDFRVIHNPKTDIEVQSTILEDTVSNTKLYHKMKRVMDVICSLAALIVLSPVFLITIIFIRLEDGGPAIFKQKRNGYRGKVFWMYKFRSMCINAEKLHKTLLTRNEADGPVFKIKCDPRVTKVGKFIRKTSIDELPQLINVLRGEMTIVGPRPIVTYETDLMSDYEKQRMLVKPGLTCYWQCSGRNDVSFHDWIEMDLKYIREASLWVDFKIICKTALMVIRGTGAY